MRMPREKTPITGLVLTSRDAAQSVPIGPLCLLSRLAAQPHVGYMVGFYWSNWKGFVTPGDAPYSLRSERFGNVGASSWTSTQRFALSQLKLQGLVERHWALGATRSTAHSHGASRGAFRWPGAFTWGVSGTVPVRKGRHLHSIVLGNSYSPALPPSAQVRLRRPMETSSRAGGTDLVPDSAALLFDGPSSLGLPGERLLSGCTSAILHSQQRDRLGRGTSLRPGRSGPPGRWAGFSSFLWVYSARLKPIANTPLVQMACLLQARRRRALAARTATAQWHVGGT